ncbi:short-subunit dehydrogenase involved in D-alanine esterification of teichoic acids [Azospirillum sp. BE72]|nr:short-subunit dehydrogenase involved in D-alanine esterification of teichoic acids [Azospirillum sp. BE72]
MTAANPGMKAVELDIADPVSIQAAAERLIAENPTLNVLINNAGPNEHALVMGFNSYIAENPIPV